MRLPGKFRVHDHPEVFGSVSRRKCLAHEIDLRRVSDLGQLATVAAHEELRFAGVHHHPVLGEPGAQLVQQALKRLLQLRQPAARTRDRHLCIVSIADREGAEAADAGGDVTADVVADDVEQEWPKARALERANVNDSRL